MLTHNRKAPPFIPERKQQQVVPVSTGSKKPIATIRAAATTGCVPGVMGGQCTDATTGLTGTCQFTGFGTQTVCSIPATSCPVSSAPTDIACTNSTTINIGRCGASTTGGASACTARGLRCTTGVVGQQCFQLNMQGVEKSFVPGSCTSLGVCALNSARCADVTNNIGLPCIGTGSVTGSCTSAGTCSTGTTPTICTPGQTGGACELIGNDNLPAEGVCASGTCAFSQCIPTSGSTLSNTINKPCTPAFNVATPTGSVGVCNAAGQCTSCCSLLAQTIACATVSAPAALSVLNALSVSFNCTSTPVTCNTVGAACCPLNSCTNGLICDTNTQLCMSPNVGLCDAPNIRNYINNLANLGNQSPCGSQAADFSQTAFLAFLTALGITDLASKFNTGLCWASNQFALTAQLVKVYGENVLPQNALINCNFRGLPPPNPNQRLTIVLATNPCDPNTFRDISDCNFWNCVGPTQPASTDRRTQSFITPIARTKAQQTALFGISAVDAFPGPGDPPKGIVVFAALLSTVFPNSLSELVLGFGNGLVVSMLGGDSSTGTCIDNPCTSMQVAAVKGGVNPRLQAFQNRWQFVPRGQRHPATIARAQQQQQHRSKMVPPPPSTMKHVNEIRARQEEKNHAASSSKKLAVRGRGTFLSLPFIHVAMQIMMRELSDPNVRAQYQRTAAKK